MAGVRRTSTGGAPRSAAGRAKALLALVGVLAALLVVLGAGAEKQLKPSTLAVPGTPLAEAEELAAREFESGVPVAILVRGAPARVDRDAAALVERLRDHPKLTVLGPRDMPDGDRTMRPHPGTRMVLARAETTRADFEWLMPYVNKQIEAAVRPPSSAHVTGIVAFGNGVEKASLEAAAKAEKLAMPILVVVLLLVLRSPLAALIPLALGGLAVQAGRGVIALAAELTPLDAAAITTVSMMGLALGVDYALLMVARFREELAAGRSPAEAAATARRTAGKTVLFASATLIVAMTVAVQLSPGDLLRSMAAGTVAAVIASAALAWTAVPAVLLLTGRGINRWRFEFPRRRRAEKKRRLRTGFAVPVVTVLLLALAVQALALDTGPVDPRQLPTGNPAREDFEQFADALGPGWASAFEIVAVTEDGVVTDEKTLAALEAWEKRTAKLPGVERVLGPQGVAAAARRVRRVPGALDRLDRQLTAGVDDTRAVGDQLGRVRAGVGQAREGAAAAAAGSRRLARGGERLAAGGAELGAGSEALDSGASELASGAGRLRGGSGALSRGASAGDTGALRLRRGAARLRRGLVRAERGAGRLASGLEVGAAGLGKLAEPARRADSRLADAWKALQRMTVGKADPQYLAAVRAVGEASGAVSGRHPLTGLPVQRGYRGLPTELDGAAAQLREAAAGSARLRGGIGRTRAGASRLERGLTRLRRGLARLETGLRRLGGGAEALADGLGALRGGVDELVSGAGELSAGSQRLARGASALRQGLAPASRRLHPLESGLADGQREAGERARELGRDGQQLSRQGQSAEGLFDSGYAVLAALDGAASSRQRRLASDLISVDSGGRAARLTVIPTAGPNAPETFELHDQLQRSLDELEEETGLETGLAGTGTELVTFERIITERFPLIIFALCLVTWLVLVVLFRSIWLPLIAVGLNLFTVGAAFGVLSLLVDLPSRPLGDAGFIDAISAVAIFTVTFGLSIDYQVFLLSRMREGWLETKDTTKAIDYGVSRTAGVIVGAALIMTGVFLAFAASDVANLRQMGVGLAVAVMLDATVIRLLLLPAAMRALGDWNWWLPAWLERRLPAVSAH